MSDRVVIEVVTTADGRALVGVEGQLNRVGSVAADVGGRVGRMGRAFDALKASAVVAGLTALYGAIRAVGQGMRDAGVNALLDRRLGQALSNLGEDAQEGVKGIQQTADSIERLTGIEAEQVKTAAQMLATFRSVGGTEGIQMLLPRLADMAAGTAGVNGEMADLGSIALQVGKAIENGGATLRRYGVSLTETQEEAIKAADGIERVALIAEALDANFAGLAEAAADPMTQLTNAVGNLAEEAGGPLRVALTEAAIRMTALASDPGVVRMARGVGAALGWLANAALRSVSAIQRGWISLVVGGREAVNAVVTTVAGGLRRLAAFHDGVTAIFEAISPDSLASRAARASGAALDRAIASLQGYADSHDGITASLRAQLAAMEEQASAVEARVAQGRALAGTMRGAETAAAAMGEAITRSATSGAPALDRLVSGATRVRTAVGDIRAEIDQLERKAREMQAADPAELVRLEARAQELRRTLAEIEARVEAGVRAIQRAANPVAALPRTGSRDPRAFGAEGIYGMTPEEFGRSFEPFAERARAGAERVAQEAARGIKNRQAEAYEASAAIGDAIEAGLERAVGELASALGEFAVGAASFGDVGRAILLSLAGLAQQVGAMMVSFGIAAIGLRRLLSNPAAAIAAGAALIAVGAAARAAIGRAVDNATGGASSDRSGTSYGAGPGASSVSGGLALGAAFPAGGRARDGRSSVPVVNVAAPPVPVPIVEIHADARGLYSTVRHGEAQTTRLHGRADRRL